MHELSICQALIEQVETLAREQGARQVVRIRVGIGPLAGVEPVLLEQAFQIARAGSVAAAAGLDLDNLPVRVSCPDCGRESDAQAADLTCGHCGNWRTRLVSGDELLLTEVELVREPARGAAAAAKPN